MAPNFTAMNWTTISPCDLSQILNKNQLDLLKAESLRNGDASMPEKAIDLAVSRVRAEIAASGLNMLDENYSKIPPELRECAMRLAAAILQTRIPTMEFTASQKKALENCLDLLKRVSDGLVPVTRPRNAVRTARKYSISFGGQKRRLSRSSTEGF